MRNTVKTAARSRVALSYAQTQKALAYEASREKPEDKSPLAAKPTFRNRLADWASRIFSRFLDFFRRRPAYRNTASPFNPRRKIVRTAPRGSGDSRCGSKLYRRMLRYRARHPILPMVKGQDKAIARQTKAQAREDAYQAARNRQAGTTGYRYRKGNKWGVPA